MASKPKTVAQTHVDEGECYELPEDTDILEISLAFIQRCNVNRDFHAVKKNDAGTDVLTIKITTPR